MIAIKTGTVAENEMDVIAALHVFSFRCVSSTLTFFYSFFRVCLHNAREKKPNASN